MIVGRGARRAAETVDVDDVRARAGDAAGDCGDVVHGGYLDRDRLGVFDRLLEREDELPQVLDGVDVVVRRRGKRVGAGGDHARRGDLVVDLFAGQMPADAGLGALADLYLYADGGLEVLVENAEAP